MRTTVDGGTLSAIIMLIRVRNRLDSGGISGLVATRGRTRLTLA